MAGGRDKEMTNRYEPNTCEATSDRKVARQASVWKETLSKLGQEVGRFSYDRVNVKRIISAEAVVQ